MPAERTSHLLPGLIGHYRVVSTLGTGGMGVVWKAIDTRLNRPVAIKAIRETVGAETQAVLRLRAEALAAAALDHPYICKIFELLETEQGTLVVMEFVEGETLDAILDRGVPPLLDTLRYGSEIAEGLANAHAKGIIHRDVKPSNVMITPHGHVKLLDFGIARAAAAGDLPTEAALTKPGMIPGTPQYMAPEQALGKRIDARVDVFALGVLLFECLAGQRPYDGATRDAYVQEMLAGRMRPLDKLAPAAPEPVRDIVKDCLDRKAEKRPTATAVADTLRRYADAISTASTGLPVARSRGLPRWVLQVAALALATAALVLAWRQWQAAPADDDARRALMPAVTWPSAESDPRISPDGKWLSFISDRDNQTRIFVKSIDGGDAVPVVLAGVAESHAWSPDGRELACVMRQNEERFLVIVPAFFGGTPRLSVRLDRSHGDPTISRWIGETIYLRIDPSSGRALASVTLPEGRIDRVPATWPPGLSVRFVDLSADGTTVAVEGFVNHQTDIWIANTDGSNLRQVTNDQFVDRHPVWSAPGVVAFQSNRGGQLDLWQHTMSTGRVAQMTSSDSIERPGGGSSDGSVLAFEHAVNNVHLWRSDVVGGTTKQLTGDALTDFWPSVTSDDAQMAFQRTRPTPTEGYQFLDARVFVTPLATAPNSDPQSVDDGFGARFSPNGKWVAYFQRLADAKHFRLVVRDLATGQARHLSDRCTLPGLSLLPVDWTEQTLAWSPDSADLFFLGEGERGAEIRRARLHDTGQPTVVVEAPAKTSFRDLRISPDGKRLAYLAGGGGSSALHVIEVTSRHDTVLLREERAPMSRYLPGWAGHTSLILQDTRRTGGRLYENRFEEVTLDGTRRPVATIEGAAVTARVDAARRRIFVSRAVDGVHNVYVITIADGSVRRVTINESPSVYFSGITPLKADSIVYARDERKRDIWLVRKGEQ